MGDWDVVGERSTSAAPPDPWAVVGERQLSTSPSAAAKSTVKESPQVPAIPKPTGPTFSAAPERPWYQEALSRARDVVTGPGAALNRSLGEATGAQIASDNVDTAPTDKPILDIPALKAEDVIPGTGTVSKVARGVTRGVEKTAAGLTTPTNAALLATIAGIGKLAPLATETFRAAFPVVERLASTGFSLGMLKGAFEQSPKFAEQVKNGDYEGAAQTLTEIGLGTALGVSAARHGATDPEFTPRPIVSDSNLRARAPSPQATSLRPTDEALAQVLRVEPPGPKRDALAAEAQNRGIAVPELRTRAQDVADTLGETSRVDQLFDQGDKRIGEIENSRRAPNARNAGAPPVVPENGIPEDVARGIAARDDLAVKFGLGEHYADLSAADQLAIDDLIAEGNTGAPEVSPALSEPAPPQPKTILNAGEYAKAHTAWKKATIEAAAKLSAETGIPYQEAEQSVAGRVGREPDPDDYQIPAPPPEPAPAPEPPKPSSVKRVSPATPNPPTAALPTAPESPETIAIQLQQLGTHGAPVGPDQRKAVMFPKGTPVDYSSLVGLSITHDPYGNTYAYRPDLITDSEIRSAARNNRLPEVLGGPAGMGAPDKTALQGEPVAVVSMAPDGTEVQTTATDAQSLPQTVTATHAVTPPGGTVHVMPPASVVEERIQNSPESQTMSVSVAARPEPSQTLPNSPVESQTLPPPPGFKQREQPLRGEVAPSTRVLKIVNGPEGTQAEVADINGKFSVIVRDNDSGGVLGNPRIFPTREAAEAYADTIAPTHPEQPAGTKFTNTYIRTPATPEHVGDSTDIEVEGRSQPYKAHYAVRELEYTYPSHEPANFQPNPEYHFKNDRDYNLPANKARVMNNSGGNFNPRKIINDNPDAVNGPTIIDPNGNAMGGNNRRMTLERVYRFNKGGAQAYRDLLVKKATQFGLDPVIIAGMKRPILVRVIDEPITDPQRVITDLNKEPTAELSTGERAAADARGVTPEIGKYLGRSIEGAGPDASLSDVLNGRTGAAIVNHLIKEGIFTETERPSLLDANTGAVTKEAKDRISKMLLGGLFRDSERFQEAEPSLRNKLERVAPILQGLRGKEGWDLTPDTQQAIDQIEFEREYRKAYGRAPGEIAARAISEDKGGGLLAQNQAGLFGEITPPDVSPRGRIIADFVRENSPRAVTQAFRRFAEKSEEQGLFGETSPEDAFGDVFGQRSDSGNASVPLPGNAAIPSRQQTSVPANTAPATPPTTPIPNGTRWLGLKDAFLKIAAPAARSEGSRQTGYAMREMGAKLAREDDIAQEALRSARKLFAGNKPAANFDFIDRVENGTPQTTPALQQIADTVRQMLDSGRDEIRAMGKDHLQKFYENYFPHIWKDPAKAQDVMGKFFEKRPLQGSKAFLKQRTLPTFADGIERGLEPVSDNPVDLVLLKLHEMAKYRLAHEAMGEMKDRGLLQYFSAAAKVPAGYKRIDDTIATVFGKPTVTVKEFFDQPLMDRLNQFARSLGITHERNVSLKGRGIPRNAAGFASTSGAVQTKFGSPESVLAHEIGHQLEYRYGISAGLKGPGIAKELDNLAALRWEGAAPSASYKTYARSVDEKMANAIAAMIYAPERFREVAPHTWDLLRDELYSHPELRSIFDIKKSMTLGSSEAEVPVGGMVVRGHYWAPEDRATVINNFLSPGLRGNPIYDAYMAVGNTLNQAQLGFSAFHLGTTVMEAMISRDAMAVRQLAEGHIKAAAKSHLSAVTAPFSYAIQGNKLLQEWLHPGTQGGDFAMLADAAIKAGARARQDKFYESGQADKVADAFRRGGFSGTAQGIARLPFAVMDLSSRPLMRYLIPRLKLGAFADLARFEIARLPEGSTTANAQAALSRAWDSIDNRLGQMTYDNLFWNKVGKDLAMASVRAVGWSLGSLREGLGGIKDLAAGNSDGERVTNRSAYLAGAAIRTGIMGAMTYYLLTGKVPQRLKDYYFPGGHSMPGFLKDAVNWTTHPWDTAQGKIHPLLPLAYDMLTNTQGFYDQPITKEDWKTAQHYMDIGKYALKDALPISVRNIIKGDPPTEDDTFQFFGAPKEPRAIRDETGPDAHSRVLKEIEEDVRTHKDATGLINRSIAAGQITRNDVRSASRRARNTSLQNSVVAATMPRAIAIFDHASVEEKAQIASLVRAKVQRAQARSWEWDPATARLAQKYFHMKPRVEFGNPKPIQ